MPIGGVIATQGAVIPNAVGADIGCGMPAIQTSLEEDMVMEEQQDLVDIIVSTRFSTLPSSCLTSRWRSIVIVNRAFSARAGSNAATHDRRRQLDFEAAI